MKLSANGVEGFLIRCFDGQYRFRVYKVDLVSADLDFTDYDLLHSDLCVTITDADATFYSDNERNVLDHSPETLAVEE
jgi:hypothetical protein